MLIAIDGPAASGKGTLAKLLAAEFHLAQLDTGKLYRLVAWRLLQQDFAWETLQSDTESKLIEDACQDIAPDALTDTKLQDEQIGKYASLVSANQSVRKNLIPIQRNLAQDIPQGKKGAVLDGRDIGTIILPHADYKFFLTADIAIRAERRYQELQLAAKIDSQVTLEEIEDAIRARDEADSKRALAPLKAAEDAIALDSTEMNIAAMFAKASDYIYRNPLTDMQK